MNDEIVNRILVYVETVLTMSSFQYYTFLNEFGNKAASDTVLDLDAN